VTAVGVLVVGAGQAGLAAGYWLRQTPLDVLLVDRAARVGDSWRQRWESLVLFTPASHSALPGLPVPGDPDAYPTREAIADYLEAYARHFDIPVQLRTAVTRLTRDDIGFVATLSDDRMVHARSVIVATGAFQVPHVPDVAKGLDALVAQFDPNTYRNPRTVPPGTALVVGDGATGRQIALDLAGTHRVVLATGRPRRVSPDRVLGRSVFWWLDRLGIARLPRGSRLGRALMRADPFPGKHLALRGLAANGVQVRPRVATMRGDQVTFVDGSQEAVAAVVWATGYRDDVSWVDLPGAVDEAGRFIERAGDSPVAGLHFVGRSWQRNRGSALLLGVGQDARLVVERVSPAVGAPDG
jgi:putative flavoprotein involved in K+ transport